MTTAPTITDSAPAAGRPWITVELVSLLRRSVPHRAALVWLLLWARSARSNGEAWPSVRSIATDLALKAGHVSEDIGRLEGAGWLAVNREPGNKSTYQVRAPREVYPETGTVAPEGVSQNGNGVCPETGTHCAQKREQHPNLTSNLTSQPKRARAKAAALDFELTAWLQWWNGLYARGLVRAGVDEAHPSAAVLAGWAHVKRSPELRRLLADRDALASAIQASSWIQDNGGWFRLEKLFGGRNKEGEYIARKLVDGAYGGPSGRGNGSAGLHIDWSKIGADQ